MVATLLLRMERFIDNARSVSERKTIRVVVRVRPLQPHEHSKGERSVLNVTPDHKTLHATVGSTVEHSLAREYQFDYVGDQPTTQEKFFSKCGLVPLLDAALAGVNVSVFAYGQTGSGKTYSTMGPAGGDPRAALDHGAMGAKTGIIPRALAHLFDQISRLPADLPRPILRISCAEIYCEGVFDLLLPGGDSLPVRQQTGGGYFVQGQLVVPAGNLEDVLTILSEAAMNRSTGSHALNRDSSRSHAVTTIYLEIPHRDPDTGKVRPIRSKIMFVDLAGSERLKESQSEGVTAVESRQINKSLFTLGKVIAALSDKAVAKGRAQAAGATADGSSSFIPYRDSKLTQLLQDALGGTSLTLMISCLTPAASHLDESLNTLQYALRASRIENAPLVQLATAEHSKETTVVKLKKEAALLQAENSSFRSALGLPPSGHVSDEVIASAIQARMEGAVAQAMAQVAQQQQYSHPAHDVAGSRSPVPVRSAASGRGRTRKGATSGRRASVTKGVGSAFSTGSASGDEDGGVEDSHSRLTRAASLAVAGLIGGSSVSTTGSASGYPSKIAERAADRASRQLVIDAQQAELVAMSHENNALRFKTTQQRARIGALTRMIEDHKAMAERLQAELAAARRALSSAEVVANQAMTAAQSKGFGHDAASLVAQAKALQTENESLKQQTGLMQLRLDVAAQSQKMNRAGATFSGRSGSTSVLSSSMHSPPSNLPSNPYPAGLAEQGEEDEDGEQHSDENGRQPHYAPSAGSGRGVHAPSAGSPATHRSPAGLVQHQHHHSAPVLIGRHQGLQPMPQQHQQTEEEGQGDGYEDVPEHVWEGISLSSSAAQHTTSTSSGHAQGRGQGLLSLPPVRQCSADSARTCCT